jgi:hypothetical protein
MTPRLFKTREGYLAFLARLKPGAYHAVILHEGDACASGRCVCRPWYRVEDATVENLLEGQEAERAWRKGAAS